MPNTKSAIRRVRRVKKQIIVNRIRKSKYKNTIKHMENLINSKDKEKAKKYFPKFQFSGVRKCRTVSIFNKKNPYGLYSGETKSVSLDSWSSRCAIQTLFATLGPMLAEVETPIRQSKSNTIGTRYRMPRMRRKRSHSRPDKPGEPCAHFPHDARSTRQTPSK